MSEHGDDDKGGLAVEDGGVDGGAFDDSEGRGAVEDVVLAFRPEAAARFGGDLKRKGRLLPPKAQALERLAAADLPRLLKHRLLLEAVRRDRDGDPRQRDVQARLILRSTLRPEVADDEAALDAIQAALERVRRAPGDPSGRLQQEHWEQWVRATDRYFRFEIHERTFRTVHACDDRDLVDKPDVDWNLVPSRLIVAEFWSDLTPLEFADYIDPRNWPRCSRFWEAMVPQRGLEDREPRPSYDCDFEERVRILDEVLEVPLSVGFRVRADGSRVWTRFNMDRGRQPAEVDVDTGTISAETRADGPAPTLVRATKYLHWSDRNRPDYTELACDTGWTEMMIEMASRCAGRNAAARTAGPRPARRVDGVVERFVAGVASDWKEGIDGYRPHAQRMITRLTGSSWDPGWVNDLLGMGRVAVDRYANFGRLAMRLADSFRHADDQEEQP